MCIDDTRSAYDLDPDREWNRLDAGAQARLEYLITRHALGKHLPRAGAGRVLDAGGGPGRYTIALAEQGYHVTLLDLSPRLLDLAQRKIAALPASTQARIDAIVEGSITDLSRFPDGGFDAVLCLGGPLSHVVDPAARMGAIGELGRVTRPGGLLFVSVLGRIGAYRSAVQWIDWFDGVFPAVAETGRTTIGPGKAPAYFYVPDELCADLTQVGLEVVHLYGCQGIGAHLDEANLLALMADRKRWPLWERELLATCDHPAIVGVSNLILAVARKPSCGVSPPRAPKIPGREPSTRWPRQGQ